MHKRFSHSTLFVYPWVFVWVAFCDSLLAIPPDRLNVGGLGDSLVTTIETDDSWYLSEVTRCGDVDGDGLDDLLLRVHLPDSPAGDEDLVVLLYGGKLPSPSIDPVRDDVRKTTVRTGRVRTGGTTTQITGGEDIDADGLPDFAASSFEESIGGAGLLVILGGVSLPEEIEARQIGTEIRGTIIVDSNPTDPRAVVGGALIALSPDINGDGYAEMLVVETAGHADRKRCIVLFGAENLPPRIDLVDVGASVGGFTVLAPGDMPLGRRGLNGLTSLGDVNGDGLADLGFVVGNSFNHPDAGYFDESYVLFGRVDFPGTVHLGALGRGRGIRFPQYEQVARSGDVDGDGLEDLVLFHSLVQLQDGHASILYSSRRELFPEVIDRDAFRSKRLGISVEEPACLTGCGAPRGTVRLSLGRGMDLDGDGRSDVLLGASGRGVAYGGVVLGLAGAAFFLRGGDDLPDTISTDDIAQDLGVRIDGKDPMGRLGTEVFMLDDFDGDGTRDIVLTSRSAPCSGASRKVWIVSGQTFQQPPARVGLIQPAQGWIDGGNLVTVFGTGFDETPRVHFGSREADVTTVLGSGVVIAVAPPGEVAGDVSVRVTTGRGQHAAGELRYTYTGAKNDPLMVDEDDERTLRFRHFDHTPRGAAVGDFNGDDDLDAVIVDGYRFDGANWEFHIVFGSGKRGPDVELELLQPEDGVTIEGSLSELGSPSRLAAGGDIDGDGFDDFVARFDPEGRFEWRVILGRTRFREGVRLRDLSGTIRFVGAEFHLSEDAAAIVPDVSGDGFDDLLIASRSRLYIVKGRESFPGEVSLDDIAAAGEGAIYDTDEFAFSKVAGSAGDFNGDGALDLFFAGRGHSRSGAVAVLYGGSDLFPGREVRLEESLLRDTGGLLITGRVRGGYSFWTTVPGDLDGDGLSEIFLNQFNGAGCTFFPNSGEGFVLSRKTVLREGFSEAENSTLAATYGKSRLGVPDFALSPRLGGAQAGVLHLESRLPDEEIGIVASPAGDFNGDGYGDLLIGGAGASAYVVFGSPDLLAGPPVNLTQADERVLVLRGDGVERVARFVSGGFDWDGDGVDDILLGGSDRQVRIVFGVAASSERTFIRGDADRSGGVNLSDAVLILTYLFSGLGEPPCLDPLDVNDDGIVNISDAGAILVHLFSGGSAPPPPYPGAGFDPTSDDLRCTE